MKSCAAPLLQPAAAVSAAAGGRLLRVTRHALEAGDADLLVAALAGNFGPRELLLLLGAADPAVRCVAALGLGLTANGTATEAALARRLHDAAAAVAAAAEHALWSVWLRGNGGAGVEAFEAGLAALAAGREAAVADAFEEAVRIDPGFAEAHHQLAISHALAGDEAAAEAAFGEAVRCNPGHFAALAGAGHAASGRGDLAGAEALYRRALRVHPSLAGVAAALGTVTEALAQSRLKRVG